jgi:hypothetical protein
MVVLGYNRVLRTTGASSLLAVAFVFAPQRASAACGDYVMIGGDQGHPDSGTPGHDPDAPRQPCHGPGCSAAPCGPILPPVPPTSPTNPSEALAGLHGGADGASSPDWYPRPVSSGRAVHRPPLVFHPPTV